jgi:predicted  nucleic acid-binding Zn-ribbon protein
MKSRWIIGLSVAWCGLISAGVDAGEQPVTPGTITREAIEATARYTTQQKEAFQRKAQEEFEAIQKQMAALQGNADKASVSARTELQKSIHELEEKKGAARKQLDGLKSASDATWNEMKAGVHAAIEEMNQSYQRLRSKVQ